MCGETIVESQVLPATGHNEVTAEGYDATCTDPGLSTGVYCDVCGEWIVQQLITEPTGHSWVQKPNMPYEEYECEHCGETTQTPY